jgi:three-Cys-motif partner protein
MLFEMNIKISYGEIMSKPSTTFWPIGPHTQAKHAILKRYLQAWFPILSQGNKRIVYIDGFAGPGEYEGGEPGSPIIAMNTAIEHTLNLNSGILFWFIEENKERCENLKNILASMEIPNNITFHVVCKKFDESLSSTLDHIDENGGKLAPTFAFIDPFGISDTPFSIIERIMAHKKCEVLITFMSGFLNRFKGIDDNIEHIDKLFGTTDWKHEILENSEEEGEEQIVEYYQERLKTVAKFARSFEMINKSNQTIYRLIFGTNSFDGLKKMKEAMWKIDENGTFRYSDRTDPSQTFLFKPEPDYQDLKRLIINRFKRKTATIEEIECFVVAETPYRETHFKKQILKDMEMAQTPEIKIIASPRKKKGSYPPGTQINFLEQPSFPEQPNVPNQPNIPNQTSFNSFFK